MTQLAPVLLLALALVSSQAAAAPLTIPLLAKGLRLIGGKFQTTGDLVEWSGGLIDFKKRLLSHGIFGKRSADDGSLTQPGDDAVTQPGDGDVLMMTEDDCSMFLMCKRRQDLETKIRDMFKIARQDLETKIRDTFKIALKQIYPDYSPM